MKEYEIRIDFAYSRNDQFRNFGCTICANTIYGAQFGNPTRRHLVSIEEYTIAIYEDGIKVKDSHRPDACPVNLRKWEEEDEVEQF